MIISCRGLDLNQHKGSDPFILPDLDDPCHENYQGGFVKGDGKKISLSFFEEFG